MFRLGGKKFPDLELLDINQNKITITDKEEYTLFTFWDISCKPCIEELISLNVIAEEYPNVCFIAITANSNIQVSHFFSRKRHCME